MTDNRKRERGRVRWYKVAKGYGRITSAEFNDILSLINVTMKEPETSRINIIYN